MTISIFLSQLPTQVIILVCILSCRCFGITVSCLSDTWKAVLLVFSPKSWVSLYRSPEYKGCLQERSHVVVVLCQCQVIDYSVPFFYSGVSCLSFNRLHSDSVPLTAFLVPFSPHLWIAIFASLFVTAVAAAIYEWLSPFGLNPWGRQRTKNFTLASASWVMTSLLFSHLVTFKAPKSWPNKVGFPLLVTLGSSCVLLCT